MGKKKVLGLIGAVASIVLIVGVILVVRKNLTKEPYPKDMVEKGLHYQEMYAKELLELELPKDVAEELTMGRMGESLKNYDMQLDFAGYKSELRELNIDKEEKIDASDYEKQINEKYDSHIKVDVLYDLQVSVERRYQYNFDVDSPELMKFNLKPAEPYNGTWSPWQKESHEMYVYSIDGEWHVNLVD